MGRLSDFDINDSSEAVSPHAGGGTETEGEKRAPKQAERSGPARKAATRAPAQRTARLGTGLPDPKAAPAEQLVLCERAIHDAKVKFHRAAEDAMAAFVDEAGPYIAWVHQHKLYRHMKGNNGKPYRSFNRYLKEQHDISTSSGYRITRTIPLIAVLECAEHPVSDLSVRQVQALHPVRVKHGDEAVEKVWETAWSTKKAAVPSPDELEKAKTLLGLEAAVEEEEEDRAAAPSLGAELEKARRILAPETLREAVRQEPDRVVLLARVVNAALREAGIDVEQ